jgi:uncharacterized membrane protein YdjX (TVP38/TMEM64 family)
MEKFDNSLQPDAAFPQKLFVCALVIAAYALTNYFLRIHLPGVSNVDLRPQIILIFVVGYLYGPFYGFLAGFAGNFCTDLLFGYGLRSAELDNRQRLNRGARRPFPLPQGRKP